MPVASLRLSVNIMQCKEITQKHTTKLITATYNTKMRIRRVSKFILLRKEFVKFFLDKKKFLYVFSIRPKFMMPRKVFRNSVTVRATESYTIACLLLCRKSIVAESNLCQKITNNIIQYKSLHFCQNFLKIYIAIHQLSYCSRMHFLTTILLWVTTNATNCIQRHTHDDTILNNDSLFSLET